MRTIQMACRSTHLSPFPFYRSPWLADPRRLPRTPNQSKRPFRVQQTRSIHRRLNQRLSQPLHASRVGPVEMTETTRAQLGAPALAVGIIQGDEMVAWGASGFRAAGDETPVSLNDKWHMGSNTKAMTAHLVAILVQEGVLRWDTTVAEVYSDLNPPEGWSDVSILDLCRHRSGIRKLNTLVCPFLSIPRADTRSAKAVGRTGCAGSSPQRRPKL